MTDDEQKAFSELQEQVRNLTAENAVLKTQRDTFKKGFETQSKLHREAADRMKKKEDDAALEPVPVQ